MPLFAALPPADLPTVAYVPTALHTAELVTERSAERHTVRSGDTVYDIAARYGVSPTLIVHANNLSEGGRWILPGTTLVVPGANGTATSTSSEGSPAKSSSAPAPAGGTVTVRSGDTLTGIAARNGISVAALAKTNRISTSDFIYPGQQLRLPAGTTPEPLDRPYDASTIGDKKKGEKVEDTFLHYRYSDGVARSAAANRDYLGNIEVPSREAMKKLIVETSNRHGVDHTLMLALSYQESGWNMRAVSPANAIGVMQVIPASGEWASALVGRELNLLDPADNVEAGVVIMRALLHAADKDEHAIGGYYQGLASVREHGLFADTKQYVRNIRHFMGTL